MIPLLGSSTRPTPSDEMSKNAGGLMNKFNPLNLAKGLTGGNKKNTMGNVMGTDRQKLKAAVSKKGKDPEFTTVGPSSTAPVRRGDSVADISAKVYNLINRKNNSNIKEDRMENKLAKELSRKKEKRHRELIKALTEKPKEKVKEIKVPKKEEAKVPTPAGAIKPTPPAAAAPKPTPPAAAAPKPTPPAAPASQASQAAIKAEQEAAKQAAIKAEQEAVKKAALEAEKEAAKKAALEAEKETAKKAALEAEKETAKKAALKAEKETAKKAAKETATPAKPSLPSASPAGAATSTATQIAVGAGVAIGGLSAAQAADIATKISSGETGNVGADAYNQANMPAKTTVKESKITKGNIDVTTKKPFEKDLTEMTISEVMALGNRRAKYYKGSGGSAMGKYQFIPGTLEKTAKNLYGKGWETKLFDSKIQEELNNAFIMSNAEQLKKSGVPVSDAAIYMMHFFGNPIQTGMVMKGNDNDPMLPILDYFHNLPESDKRHQKAQPSKQNQSIAKLTIGQYKERLKAKGFDFKIIESTKTEQKTPSKTPDTGKKVSEISTEHKELKKTASAGSSSVFINNNTTVAATSSPTQVMVMPSSDESRFIQGVTA